MNPTYKNEELLEPLREAKRAIVNIGLLSGMLNILLLGGSIYMMLIYDSALPSRSLPTLFSLFLLITIIYVFQAIFDVLRSQMLANVGAHFDARLSSRVQNLMFDGSLRHSGTPNSATGPLRDLDSIRTFLASPGPAAIIDLPWIFFFLAVLAILHYWLAVTTLVGAIILVGLTLITSRKSSAPAEEYSRMAGMRSVRTEEVRRHAELISALGMKARMLDRLNMLSRQHLLASDSLTRTSLKMAGVSKVFRMFLQSLVLTVGALLVMSDKATGGIIFASSILSARALAPIDQVIGSWKPFIAAQISWKRLAETLKRFPATQPVTTILPPPSRQLTVDSIAVIPPGQARTTVQGKGFSLEAGDVLGIIGPSGSGKSSLIRAIVGAWPVSHGTVRLDGATLDQYDPTTLGQYTGYLPQSVELLSGTVGENISRFTADHDSEEIVKAAKAAGAHDLIVSFPKGYDTPVGEEGDQLSAGQRQRVALARALFNDPFLIALDEPNANLDEEGEAALDAAIATASKRGAIVIIIAHRPSALKQANKVLLLRNGVMEAFGPKDKLLSQLLAGRASATHQQATTGQNITAGRKGV